ncbi:class I SAM-dependent DNA methyltransferase [Chryseobacterium bernardetii]|uniref:class I SAM-dependent DNA methyltransferase n=1 Tax=Chryseobacterium bernardetii TaxID=1241978 RepID=UPI000F4FFB7E|nr:N-6 DNA methylase [Chryseobacterium bernardetii]AZB34802.1 SAM-dependent DNA methyltransferase [Chryseobacterium bernardetii]
MDVTAKLWSFCHILRHDGVDYVDYIEQLTYLLFLKMADESEIVVPEKCSWKDLLLKSGDELKIYYEEALLKLKNESGILGQIFQEPISKIQNPVSLKKIIDGIESVGWTKLDKDIQGEAFEGLLEKTANEGKKGAGQFFTPRPLIEAIVNVMKPNPLEREDFKIGDVACGTAGFLTMAVDWAKSTISHDKWYKVKDNCYYGQELVVRPYRLALMNLFLHGVKGNLLLGDSIYSNTVEKNSMDCILTNPPFGTRGTLGPPKSRNFSVETTNLQINFIQHVFEILKENGRAAIVLPDSSLTDSKAKEVWETLIEHSSCNIHTILRLPNGTFTPYANGVKACVVFLHKGKKTKNIWVYDARTDVEDITKSTRPLDYEKHFQDFVFSYGENCYGTSRRKETERFKKYSIELVKEKQYDLSFSKLFQPAKLDSPKVYVEKLIDTFEKQLIDLKNLKDLL